MDVSLTQLQAIALILQMAPSRNREELMKQIVQRLRSNGGPSRTKGVAVNRVERSRSRDDRSQTEQPRKALARSEQPRNAHSRNDQAASFNGDAYKAALEGVARRGYNQVVAALVNRANGKRWILLRKPNSNDIDDRVTVWGNASGGPRKIYGGNAMSDEEFIESKKRLGYERDPGLLRAARNATRRQ